MFSVKFTDESPMNGQDTTNGEMNQFSSQSFHFEHDVGLSCWNDGNCVGVKNLRFFNS